MSEIEFVSTEGMNEALDSVKQAVSSKELVAYLTHYLIKDHEILATDGRMMACTKFPDPRAYLVPADEFERALLLVGDDGKISLKEDCIWVSSKSRRVKISTLPEDQFIHLRPQGDLLDVPDGFIPALTKLRPFISEDATKAWSNGIMCDENDMLATNNVSIAMVTLEEPFANIIVPKWLVDFILKHPSEPSHFSTHETHMAFYFSDGSWVRSQLINEDPPQQVFSLMEECPVSGGWEITQDWRKAYEDLVSISDDEINVGADKLTGGRRHALAEIDAVSPVAVASKWNPKFMNIVLEAATHLDMDDYPKPCKFWGNGIRGLMVGRN